MAPRYVTIEGLVPQRVLEKLQQQWPNGKSFTAKAAGPLSVGEQELPAEVCTELRSSMDFGGRPSRLVRLASAEAAVASSVRSTASRLAKRGHSARSVADATGLSEAMARHLGANKGQPMTTQSESQLWVGLAAIRQYHAIPQALMAERMGCSQVRLSQLERRQSSPEAQDVDRYLEALAVTLRVSPTRLRRRAIEAGAAVLDTGVSDGTSDAAGGDAQT